MKAIQPKMKAIRNAAGTTRPKQQEEIMALYEGKASPAGGLSADLSADPGVLRALRRR